MGLTANEEAALDDIVWELTGPHSTEAIAKRLGCSRKHVWEVEVRAMKKLRALIDPDWRDP